MSDETENITVSGHASDAPHVVRQHPICASYRGFRPWSATTIKRTDGELFGLKFWWDTPSILHPAPLLIAIIGAALLITLPNNILTISPVPQQFVSFMVRLIPGINTFSENQSEVFLLVHAFNWFFFPYWLYLTFKGYPFLKISNKVNFRTFKTSPKIQVNPNLIKKLAVPSKNRTRLRVLFAIVYLPIIIPFCIWSIWSGFIFEGGTPALVKGLVYDNLLLITFWNWFIPQSFCAALYSICFYIAMLPIHINYIITGEIK